MSQTMETVNSQVFLVVGDRRLGSWEPVSSYAATYQVCKRNLHTSNMPSIIDVYIIYYEPVNQWRIHGTTGEASTSDPGRCSSRTSASASCAANSRHCLVVAVMYGREAGVTCVNRWPQLRPLQLVMSTARLDSIPEEWESSFCWAVKLWNT